MAVNPDVNLQTLSPAERLRALAVSAFPHALALQTTGLGRTITQVWHSLIIASEREAWEFAAGISAQLDIPLAEKLTEPDPNVARLIPEALARSTLIVPLRESDGGLDVACACPFEGGGIRRVAFVANRRLNLFIAPANDIEAAITSIYTHAAERQSRATLGSVLFTDDDADSQQDSAPDESAVVQLAKGLIIKAVKAGASDLHLQPFAGGGMARIRVDGILRRLAYLPGPVMPALIRYIKANGGMDSTSDRITQDGRVSAVIDNRDFDIRLSVLPASRGERLVMRFLDQSRVYRMSGASFSPAELRTFRRMASSTAGVLLITGPTGSGKTSTLYSIISEVNRVGVSIITVENPVEYRVAGISQVEVNPKAGLTFASALRSILRQDPDVVLIGEIRDAETAQIAMQAALTGHLVLSTLHTNDALTAIPRLIDLGVDPSILGDALLGVVSQRLLRRLCKKCRVAPSEPYLPDEQLFRKVTGEWPGYRKVGCETCGHTGYAGRMPVTEVVEMTPELSHAVSHGDRSVTSLREITRGPLSSIAVTAAQRVISGDTSVLEAVRVIGPRFWLATAIGFKRTPPADSMLAGMEAEKESHAEVLVFHRDAEAARAIGAALEAEQFTPLLASTPEDARTLMEQHDNAILMIGDLTPGPGETGFELLKKLRLAVAWTQLPSLPVVQPDDTAVREGLESHGLPHYLVHPVTPQQIAERARMLLQYC
jgi:type IV pilus assembly protein PilB